MSCGAKIVWMAASGSAIGGAESRMVKVASTLVDEKKIQSVRFIITPELNNAYQNHPSLKVLLDHPKISIYERKRIRSLAEKILRKIYQKAGIHIRFMDKLLLKLDSWDRFYNEMITPTEDVLHCYMGDEARNGAVLFSQLNENRVIIEITNHRYLDRVSNEVKQLLKSGQKAQNLTIVSVSKKVYDGWNSQFSSDWFEDRNIQNSVYKGAFLMNDMIQSDVEKENIIIFPHRFVPPKNGILFSRVVHELFEEGLLKNWKVLFRGRGPEQGEMEKNLKKWIKKGTAEISFSNRLHQELQKSKIAVSLIETGSYPSQSIFEAMQAGCVLLLSSSGNTKEELNHPSISYTSLDKEKIKQELIKLTIKEEEELQKSGNEMKEYYQWFIRNRNQLDEIKVMYGIIHENLVNNARQ